MEDVQQIQHASTANTETGLTRRRRSTNSSTSYLRQLVERLMVVRSAQRSALSRHLGLSRQVISELLADLEIRGLVQVDGEIGGLPGRSQQFYSLRTNAALALGFEFGGADLSGALCDIAGTVVAARSEAGDSGGLVARISKMATELCADAGLSRLHVRHVTARVPAGFAQDALWDTAFGGCVHFDNSGEQSAWGVSHRLMLEQMFGPVSPN